MSPHIFSTNRDFAAGQALPVRGLAWKLPFTFLLCHTAALVLLPRQPLISLVFLCLAPLFAAGACWVRARHGLAQNGWQMLLIAMLLWTGGMFTNVLTKLTMGEIWGETSPSMLLFILYGVPIIFATASPEQESWRARLVDGALAVVLGYLFSVHTLTFATLTGSSEAGTSSLRLMFDVENLFITGFALVRFSASNAPHDRGFFGALTIFAFLYMAMAAYNNHTQETTDFGTFLDLIIDLPFVTLMGLALSQRELGVRVRHFDPGFERLVRAGSPLMLPAMLLVVSATLVRSHPVWSVIGFVSATLGHGLRNVLTQLRSFDEHDRLERLSRLDALTGLPNRRGFDETMRREWRRALRNNGSMALLMIDIDHFKLLNDHYGHPEGDRRLREVAWALAASATRGADLVARYGGEEFAVILPAVSIAQAAAVAEIMRAAVQNLALISPAPTGYVTVSVGVGHVAKVSEENADALIVAADIALYEAKRAGRNQVAVLDDTKREK